MLYQYKYQQGHAPANKSQMPFSLTSGLILYESEKTRLDLNFGFGFDFIQSIQEKTFSSIADIGFSYRYKLGELSHSTGINARLEYTIATREICFLR